MRAMKIRRKTDWVVILLAATGIAIMAYGRLIMWIGEWPGDEMTDGNQIIGSGLLITMLAVLAGAQWKMADWFLASIRWLNRRDDPRHAKRPSDPP